GHRLDEVANAYVHGGRWSAGQADHFQAIRQREVFAEDRFAGDNRVSLPALIFCRRDDDDLADRLKDLCKRRNTRCANAIVVADQDSIWRWWLFRLLRTDRSEEPRTQYEGWNETRSRHVAEIIRMS